MTVLKGKERGNQQVAGNETGEGISTWLRNEGIIVTERRGSRQQPWHGDFDHLIPFASTSCAARSKSAIAYGADSTRRCRMTWTGQP
jgi:hypothetical protein